MRLKIIFFSTLFFVCSALSWGQETVVKTWQLTPTMTATLTDDNLQGFSKIVLTISTIQSAEAMPDFNSETDVPWPSDLFAIVIEKGVSSIGKYAFWGRRGTSLSISNTVKIIGDYAFTNVNFGGFLLSDSLEVVGNYAFANAKMLRGISSTSPLPETLKVIGDYAFAGAQYDGVHPGVSMKIPNSVTSIGKGAFYGSSDGVPIRFIYFPDSEISIGSQAFGGITGLWEVSVERTTPLFVPDDIFQDTSTSELHFLVPAGTRSAYQTANGWKHLADWINDGTGEQTWKLSPTMTATLSNGTLTVSTTASSEATPSGGYNGFPWVRLSVPMHSIVVKDNITAIGANFTGNNNDPNWRSYSCPTVTSITIPKTVTSIAANAFNGSYNLKDLTVAWATPLDVPTNLFAEQVPPHGGNPFPTINIAAATLYVPAGTKALYQAHPVWGQFGTIVEETPIVKTWILSSTMTATLDAAGLLTISTTASSEAMPLVGFGFRNYPNTDVPPWHEDRNDILSVVIEDNVTSIAEASFFMCNNLTSIKIPNSVTEIGGFAFYECGLSTITIPGSVTSMSGAFGGDYHFYLGYNSNLAVINVDESNTVYSSEAGVLYNKNKSSLLYYPPKKSGNTFVIPNSVQSIGGSNVNDAYAAFTGFAGCDQITSITIPNSVTTIGWGAFSGCTGLTSIIFPNSLNSIGEGAFYGCTGITSLTIPNSVTSIGIAAFVGQTGIVGESTETINMTVEWTTPLTLKSDFRPFGYNLSASTLQVPAGTKALYETADVWKDFGTITDGTTTIPVTAIILNQSSLTMQIAETEQLAATVSPSDATNKNVSWSSSNAFIANVSSTGLVTAIAEGTAVISATSADGGFVATCNVTVSKQDIEVDDGGTNKIVLSLTIPANTPFSGTFRLVLPDGVVLDLDLTRLAGDLATKMTLQVVQNADGSYAFTLTPFGLRSATEMVYSNIVEIGYKADETVAEGQHEAFIRDLSFEFTNGATIIEPEMPLNITVNTTTGIPELSNKTFAYVNNDRLYVQSPVAESVHVYSITGLLLHVFQKPEGNAVFLIDETHGAVFIVKGSSGWVRKIIVD